MSQDLFAAFGSDEPVGENNGSSIGRTVSSIAAKPDTSAQTGTHAVLADQGLSRDEDEDDFGDFEDASTEGPPVPVTESITRKAPPIKSPAPTVTERTSRKAAPTKPPVAPRQVTKTKLPFEVIKPSVVVGNHPFAGHMDLLFAADDGDDYDAGADDLGDLSTNPEAAVAYSKRVIAAQQLEEQQRVKHSHDRPHEQPKQQAQSIKEVRRKIPGESRPPAQASREVLFDADIVSDEEQDDGFGDFEGSAMNSDNTEASQTKTVGNIVAPATMPAIDLLGFEEVPVETRCQDAPANNGPEKRSKNGELQPHTKGHDPQPLAAAREDDAWDDFEESAVPTEPSSSAKRATTPASMPKSSSSTTDQLPPTNVPPPAILLSIFPTIFASAQESLFAPLAKLDFKQRQILLAHPATAMYLKGYLSRSIVLGHILAGRKLRWKRDQYLAQGMRIGPAAAGGGMKLAGIDKAEVAKEEREVLDVVRQWKSQVGKLRVAVTTASSMPRVAKLRAVPEIAEQIPVKSLKPTEGGITATHACALCGLKREERVAKVDAEVDDSFGEWWVQGMNMHLVCRDFWEEHKGKLKSR